MTNSILSRISDRHKHGTHSNMGAVGGGMPEPAGGERRHVPLYGRLVAEEQLAAMAAPSDIQVSAVARNPRAFCCYRTPVQKLKEFIKKN
ncbi:putative serine/threonine-protein kinase minibrain [Operophtera brumata]|uniref:Putative serine/threonine-protein kinase minibrain n=1 Tax=Operophtera brumata TaxID=104452 RepID=A0A0L7LSQ9_OPEBR|nr:putative serine/threonine-protein kinase minibrain [Operophtera brumata]